MVENDTNKYSTMIVSETHLQLEVASDGGMIRLGEEVVHVPLDDGRLAAVHLAQNEDLVQSAVAARVTIPILE